MELLEKAINTDSYKDFYELLANALLGFLVIIEVFLFNLYFSNKVFTYNYPSLLSFDIPVISFLLGIVICYLIGYMLVAINGLIFISTLWMLRIISYINKDFADTFGSWFFGTDPLDSKKPTFSKVLASKVRESISKYIGFKLEDEDYYPISYEICRANKVINQKHKENFSRTMLYGLYANSWILLVLFIFLQKYLIVIFWAIVTLYFARLIYKENHYKLREYYMATFIYLTHGRRNKRRL